LLKCEIVLKDVPSGGTGVDIKELWREEAILDFEVRKLFFADETVTESSADRTAQKQQQTCSLIILSDTVRYSLY